MKSIYTTLTGLHKEGKPLDFLAMWKKTFDKASEREVALFSEMYCDKWCEFNTPQMSLTAEGIQGKYRLRFMATVIGDESPTPLRRSDGFDVWTGEIPRVGHKFPMKASEYRKLLETYRNPYIKEKDKVKAIEKTLRNAMEDAYLGCKDVMDYILLRALSNWGVCQFTPSINNPGGRAYEVDYNLPEENKIVTIYNWNSTNTAAGKVSPIFQLAALCADFRQRGVEPGEIVMSQDLYFWLKTDPVTRLLVHGTDKKDQLVKESELKDLLSENQIPPITIATRKMAQDKDGQRSTVEPWNHNFIAIKIAGKFAEIQPAIEDNELMEEEGVDYMDAGNGIRIAKWRTGDSTNQVAAEYTQGSGRLIPIITEIGQTICFQVRGITEVDPQSAEGDIHYRTKAAYEALITV